MPRDRPQAVRNAVANYNLATDFDQAMDHADNVFNAKGKSTTVAAVDLVETAPALQHDVAAVTKSKQKPNPNQKRKKFDIALKGVLTKKS